MIPLRLSANPFCCGVCNRCLMYDASTSKELLKVYVQKYAPLICSKDLKLCVGSQSNRLAPNTKSSKYLVVCSDGVKKGDPRVFIS